MKHFRRHLGIIACFSGWAFVQPARAVDEIQFYNAGIAAPDQFTIQHLNYVGLRQKQAAYPGGLVSIGSVNGTPEFAAKRSAAVGHLTFLTPKK